LIQKKKQKKRKKVLPKNYDPSVTPDPERWLPLRERSYYRGKRRNKKRDINKGPQGSTAASSAAELDASKPAVSPPSSDVGSPRAGNSAPGTGTAGHVANPPDAVGPRQAKPAAASAKQRPKKKKGGKGW